MNFNPDIIKPGTEVKIKKQYGVMFNGIVKAVWISNSGVSYQVNYFNQGKLEDPYLPREMFDVVDDTPIAVGFQIRANNEPK